MTQKLILIDGSGFIFRAYHALPPLKRPDGTPVGAVFGFCNMLFKYLESEEGTNSTYVAVIFDAGRVTFRQTIYPDYKAHRPSPPEDLIPQFAIIRQATEAFGLPAIELEGYEADDLIASYAQIAKDQGIEVVIISSDKDLMQLIGDGVLMIDPMKNKNIGVPEVGEKFGVAPNQVIDVQSLIGDASDNVPGVPGIGVKTAAELINAFGTLENLLSRVEEIKQPKRREALTTFAEQARISKQLVTLCTSTPLPVPLSELGAREPDPLILKDFLRQQGFNNLLARIDRKVVPTTPSTASQNGYRSITTEVELDHFIKEAIKQKIVAFDTETTSLNAVEAELVGISMAFRQEEGVYIPLSHVEATPQLPLDLVLAKLKPLLTDLGILKIGHNLKYDLVVLQKYGVEITPYSDTMLMSYVLDAGKNGHGMDELAERHLGYQTIKYGDVTGTGKNQKRFDEVAISIATSYAAEDADITLRLYHFFQERLVKEQMVTVYETIERPLVPVISRMEGLGIKINQPILYRLGKDFVEEMQKLEAQIYGLAGHPFNIASPKQLGEVLFMEQNMPQPKKTKTGTFVTDADVLEKLVAQGYDLPGKVLEWRGLAKLKSTYIDGLLAAVNAKTQRVHTSYAMAATTTGRLSSSEPNLQNIPIRTENGRKIREAFIADNGFKIVSLDYSQIELRLLASMAEVPTLRAAFLAGQDIHITTASEMFGIAPDQIDTSIRRKAKAINFGIIYGISAYGLSQQLNIPQSEASQYIKAYFERYPGIQDYMERMKAQARELGYVQTFLGRKCYTPGILDKNPMMRGFSERQAINAPLQGSNADIIKKAMGRIDQLLLQENWKTRLLLQVHDELVFEMPEGELDLVIPQLKKIMESIVYLNVPLLVEAGVGDNWQQAH